MASLLSPAAVSSLFDFDAYLLRIDPRQAYSVTLLTGGIVNVTVRATKVLAAEPASSLKAGKDLKETGGEGRFPGRQSIVLKYAPPFVAALGPSVPFGEERQLIEAAALSLFSPPDGCLSQLTSLSSVRVPQLLHHDKSAHVLIISDLGFVDPLSRILKVSHSRSQSFIDPHAAAELGRRLGSFFAALHSRRTLARVLESPAAAALLKDKSEGEELVYRNIISALEGIMRDAGISDAIALATIAKAEFRASRAALASSTPNEQPASTGRQDVSFTLGDSWTGAVLTGFADGNDDGPPSHSRAAPVPAERPRTTSVVDWEFAGIGSGLHSDVVGLLAHLNLNLLAADASAAAGAIPAATETLRAAILALIRLLESTYRAECRAEGFSWAQRDVWKTGDGDGDGDGDGPRAILPDVLRAVRESYVLTGQELVYYASVQAWECTCCGDAEQLPDCQLRRAMVARGAWYLRVAGADVDEFTAAERRAEILAGDRILAGLFGNLP